MEPDPHSAQSLLEEQNAIPQQYELQDYLAWRKARERQRAAHPCAMEGCGQKVSGNKVFCLACWEKAKADAVLKGAIACQVDQAELAA